MPVPSLPLLSPDRVAEAAWAFLNYALQPFRTEAIRALCQGGSAWKHDEEDSPECRPPRIPTDRRVAHAPDEYLFWGPEEWSRYNALRSYEDPAVADPPEGWPGWDSAPWPGDVPYGVTTARRCAARGDGHGWS